MKTCPPRPARLSPDLDAEARQAAHPGCFPPSSSDCDTVDLNSGLMTPEFFDSIMAHVGKCEGDPPRSCWAPRPKR